MSKIMYKDKQILGCVSDAQYVAFNNANTGLSATNVQNAITEVNGKLPKKTGMHTATFVNDKYVYNIFIDLGFKASFVILQTQDPAFIPGLYLITDNGFYVNLQCQNGITSTDATFYYIAWA